MANYFTLTLDTTAPSNPSIVLENGSQFATQQLINASISVDDGDTTGYQMKIWGDVDTSYNSNIQDTEENSSWITFNSSQQIKISDGDGDKTVNLKVRDSVHNATGISTANINYDSSKPVVTKTGPDVNRISKIEGKNVASFSFSSNEVFVEYKVKVVSSEGSPHDSGTQIPTTNGSTNMSGTGTFPAETPINCQIFGSDLETASSGDGEKIIKIFVKDEAGQWSV